SFCCMERGSVVHFVADDAAVGGVHRHVILGGADLPLHLIFQAAVVLVQVHLDPGGVGLVDAGMLEGDGLGLVGGDGGAGAAAVAVAVGIALAAAVLVV